MGKRAGDLSIGELAAMGAKAARAAVRAAQSAGLPVTGVVTTYEDGEPTASLAVLHPSGTVTQVRKTDKTPADVLAPGAGPDLGKSPN
ncbi:MAG TPA: hypothetical protein VLX44_15330 [Xanthobacteraceae bacterium]|nr:hypothetical protein [Xanthobacteraceae bacterium]